MKRYTILFTVLLIMTGFALGGCTKQTPQPNDTSTTTTNRPATTTTTTTEEQMKVTLYFVEEADGIMFLVPEKRTVPKSTAVAKISIEELIKGSKQAGLDSFIPSATKVRSINIVNGLATIDFSKEILNANVGSAGESLGIAQIVNTLTEFPSIKKVKFLVEGKDKGVINGQEVRDWWGHVGLYDQPFSRNEGLIRGGKIETDVIEIESPRAFTAIENPLSIKGKVSVFEAQFHVRILDKNGTVLSDNWYMSTDMYWGDFSEKINYKKPSGPGWGTVLFYYNSPKDGEEVVLAPVTVFFK